MEKVTGLGTFIGFGSLEEWLKSIDPHRYVCVLGVEEPGQTNRVGVRTDDLLVVVSQPVSAENLVLYVRLHVGIIEYLNGSPWGDNHAERRERFKQVEKLVREWLIEKGLNVVAGIVAQPKDLRYLDGWADFLGYDKENKRYYRKNQQAQAA